MVNPIENLRELAERAARQYKSDALSRAEWFDQHDRCWRIFVICMDGREDPVSDFKVPLGTSESFRVAGGVASWGSYGWRTLVKEALRNDPNRYLLVLPVVHTSKTNPKLLGCAWFNGNEKEALTRAARFARSNSSSYNGRIFTAVLEHDTDSGNYVIYHPDLQIAVALGRLFAKDDTSPNPLQALFLDWPEPAIRDLEETLKRYKECSAPIARQNLPNHTEFGVLCGGRFGYAARSSNWLLIDDRSQDKRGQIEKAAHVLAANRKEGRISADQSIAFIAHLPFKMEEHGDVASENHHRAEVAASELLADMRATVECVEPLLCAPASFVHATIDQHYRLCVS